MTTRPMTYLQERPIGYITQPLKKRYAVLSGAIGAIRRHSNFQSPKQICEAIVSVLCASEFLRTYDRIGLLLDGGEVGTRFLKAMTTFDVPVMLDWATTNLIILAVAAIVLCTIRPSPKRWLVTAIGKWQWRKSSR